MRLIFLCHPPSLGSTSMPRFVRMIGEAMLKRGHQVEYATSTAILSRIPGMPGFLRKWLGYVDQFLFFPIVFRRRMRRLPVETLFVVTDQALGMWVPMVKGRPHVIHCHDFLAQRSALGEFPENPTSWSGRCYQALIRRGYQQGRAFISVSRKTQSDLHRFVGLTPAFSEVVYNPLNYPFRPLSREDVLKTNGILDLNLDAGFILHVGGNQWYKNREGVVAIYRAYCEMAKTPLPLLMVGSPAPSKLRSMSSNCANGGRVLFKSDFSDQQVHCAYAAANVCLFPSLEEGFGWPIAEAQACGCCVITTDRAPMTEVGGVAAEYLRRLEGKLEPWAELGAKQLLELLREPSEILEERVKAGLENAARFQSDKGFDSLETIYEKALK
jgi:glycosyltransferase involved in cell wall biosynthesis